jgi:hypothetical protein
MLETSRLTLELEYVLVSAPKDKSPLELEIDSALELELELGSELGSELGLDAMLEWLVSEGSSTGNGSPTPDRGVLACESGLPAPGRVCLRVTSRLRCLRLHMDRGLMWSSAFTTEIEWRIRAMARRENQAGQDEDGVIIGRGAGEWATMGE